MHSIEISYEVQNANNNINSYLTEKRTNRSEVKWGKICMKNSLFLDNIYLHHYYYCLHGQTISDRNSVNINKTHK